VSEVVTFELSNGAIVSAEIDSAPEGIDEAKVPQIPFEEVKKALVGFGTDIGDAIKAISPDSASVEFGLELGGKAGIPFVTEGSATAHITVTLTWGA
jgi:hypothetical protein